MKLEQLPYILEIASCQNLSGAAQKLGISQPALSKYLSNLEGELGMELFQRYRKKLYPTPAGFLYLDMARRMQEIQEKTLSSMNLLHTAQTEYLSIGISPHRGAAEIAKLYPLFIHQFPQIRLSIQEGYTNQLREYLKNRQVSLIVSTALKNDRDHFLFAPIHHEELLLAVPPSHRMAEKASANPDSPATASLNQFADSPFIMMTPDPSIGQVCAEQFARCDFSPMIAYQTSNVTILSTLIRSGLGIGMLPRLYAAQCTDLYFFRIHSSFRITSGILWNSNHRLSFPERYLIYLLTEQLSVNPLYQMECDPLIEKFREEFMNQADRKDKD